MADQALQFFIAGTAISLDALANQVKALEGEAGHINSLNRDSQAVNRCGMGEDELDRADVDAQRHGAGAFGGASPTEVDEELSIELGDLLPAQARFQHLERRRFRSPGRLPDGLHVVDVQVDELAKCAQLGRTGRSGNFSAIDPSLGFGCPPPGVIAFEEGLAYIATLPSYLDPPRS